MSHPQFTCDEIQAVCRTDKEILDAALPSPFRVRIKDEGRALGQGEVSIMSGSVVICTASYNTEEYYARYAHGMGKLAGPQHEGAAIGLLRRAITFAEANLQSTARDKTDEARAVRALDAYLANEPPPDDDEPSPS